MSSHHLNDDGIYYDESTGVSTGDGSRGFRHQDTSQSFYRNCGVYRCVDHSDDNGIGVYRSQDTSQSSYFNSGEIVEVDRRGGYRSHTSHYSPHNLGGRGRFLGISFSSHSIDGYFYG